MPTQRRVPTAGPSSLVGARVRFVACAAIALATAVPVSAQEDEPSVLVGAGDIGMCDSHSDERTGQLLDPIPGTVFTLGDNAYPEGTAREFVRCYGPGWGRHRARTRPAPGNHDYDFGGGDGYHRYFGPAAGPPGKGYYSYDRPGWHIVVLNSTLEGDSLEVQLGWLRADLEANPGACLLAYWHHPLFSSGMHRQTPPAVREFWLALAERGADVVLNGHDHIYERFAPQTVEGVPSTTGIREFVVGTGGAALHTIEEVAANSEARSDTSHGVLMIELYQGHYGWRFVGTRSTSFRDSGTASCSPAVE